MEPGATHKCSLLSAVAVLDTAACSKLWWWRCSWYALIWTTFTVFIQLVTQTRINLTMSC